MSWFHGTVLCDLQPGDVLEPASKHRGLLANPRMPHTDPVELYDDGHVRHERSVVWLCRSKAEARDWAVGPTLKMTGADARRIYRQLGKLNLVVYEVEPVGGTFRRLTPHSDTEHGCEEAEVLRVHVVEEYDWRDWYEREHGDSGRAVDPYTGKFVELDSPDP